MTERVVLPIHGQDHCPGGPDPIPCLGVVDYFRAVLFLTIGNAVSVGSTMVDVEYNTWENSNSAVFAPKTSAGADPTEGVDLVQQVQLLQDGRYIISWGVYFTTDFDGVVAQFIHDGDPISGRPDVMYHGPSTYGGRTPSSRGYWTQTISRVYPLLDPFGSGSWTPVISTDVAQTSSANKLVQEAWLEIHRETSA